MMDQTVLNLGLKDLDLIPYLDTGERATLIPVLGRALLRLIGTRGEFIAQHDDGLYYHIRLVPIDSGTLDTAPHP
jgi:hypothetical protein